MCRRKVTGLTWVCAEKNGRLQHRLEFFRQLDSSSRFFLVATSGSVTHVPIPVTRTLALASLIIDLFAEYSADWKVVHLVVLVGRRIVAEISQIRSASSVPATN